MALGRKDRQTDKLERISLQALKTLAVTIDAKDKYTNGHSVRVAEYAREITRRSGGSEREQEEIYYIGLLHDTDILKNLSMTSKRSYRDILPQAVVRKEFVDKGGIQFDPVHVRLMVEMIDEDTEYRMRER